MNKWHLHLDHLDHHLDHGGQICLQRCAVQAREFQNYLHHDKLVEGAVDVHGNYNVVRMTNGKEYHSKLPDHILAHDPREPSQDHFNSSKVRLARATEQHFLGHCLFR